MDELKTRRKKLNLSQEAVAQASQISLSYYGVLERQQGCDPTLGVARRIAEVLGASLDDLWPARE